MALEYDVSLVSHEVRQLHRQELTDVIFLSLALGMRELTKKNVRQWAARMVLLDGVSTLPESKHQAAPKARQLRAAVENFSRFVGLKTNVTQESRSVFATRILRSVERDIDYAMRKG